MTTDELIEQLEQTGKARIHGFGTFTVQDRAATTGRNPRTGEAIDIPAKRVVRFSMAKALRETLNPPQPEPRRMVGGQRR